jgi:HAD superfamily hydrolase (TIGR01509 family)
MDGREYIVQKRYGVHVFSFAQGNEHGQANRSLTVAQNGTIKMSTGIASVMPLTYVRGSEIKLDSIRIDEMLKAVIFDFDGVVADSEFLHYKTFNGALADYGVTIDKDDYYATYLGYSDSDAIDAISENFKLALTAEQKSEIMDTKEKLFDELAANENFIIDGVAEFVAMLKDNDIRIAICSGSLRAEIEQMLSKSTFADAFELIVSADDVVKGKPDPEPYLLALSKLQHGQKKTAHPTELKACECVVIEDSHWGLESATAAGMNTIAVTNSYPAEKLAGYAKKVTDSLASLTMDELNGLCG